MFAGERFSRRRQLSLAVMRAATIAVHADSPRDSSAGVRHAARAFGDLAERLNVSLDAERRAAADRRQVPRWTEERRRADAERGRS